MRPYVLPFALGISIGLLFSFVATALPDSWILERAGFSAWKIPHFFDKATNPGVNPSEGLTNAAVILRYAAFMLENGYWFFCETLRRMGPNVPLRRISDETISFCLSFLQSFCGLGLHRQCYRTTNDDGFPHLRDANRILAHHELFVFNCVSDESCSLRSVETKKRTLRATATNHNSNQITIARD